MAFKLIYHQDVKKIDLAKINSKSKTLLPSLLFTQNKFKEQNMTPSAFSILSSPKMIIK